MLHVDIRGTGPDVVLLHGWAMNGAVWGGFADALAAQLRLHIVDLPGHGLSQGTAMAADLHTTLSVLRQKLPPRAHVIGWSLGATLALYAVLQVPDAVDRLVLIGSTPSFVASESWPHGMAPPVFAEFAQNLDANYAANLRRFLALQMLGVRDAQAQTRLISQRCLTRPTPDQASLDAGLTLLRTTRLDDRISDIPQPTLVIHGALDKLVPLASARALASALGRAELVEIADAGHAPFVSHAELLARRIVEFLR